MKKPLSGTKLRLGPPQGSILHLHHFCIYINNLLRLCSLHKLIADDTTLFPIVKDVNETAKKQNKDL